MSSNQQFFVADYPRDGFTWSYPKPDAFVKMVEEMRQKFKDSIMMDSENILI